MKDANDPGYFGRYNGELLKLIPPDAKTVLEIGCGEGMLCAVYRARNPDVEWVGVESNRESAKIAEERLSLVAHNKIEKVWEFGCCEGWSDFDCLVIGDVLEHLVDPWTVLKDLPQWLAPGAQVLASIPNIQHWTAIRALMNGEWDYTDEGLFDRTHLRFFTRKTIEAMFAAAGLQIFEVRGTRFMIDGFEPWWDTEIKKPKNGPLWVNSQIYQWIVRAVKPPENSMRRIGHPETLCVVWSLPKLHIHAITAEPCCARPRIHEPFAALATIPGVTCTASEAGSHPVFKADILIQQRAREFDADFQKLALAKGSLIVAELDDHPDGLEGYREADYMQLRAVHAIQVSTERLADVVREYNPNVAVFENQIAMLPPFKIHDGHECTRIFYGAQNRENDWKPIIDALNRAIDDRDVLFEIVHDREFFQAVRTTNKRFHPFLPYEDYRAVLRSCDIALLPLEPGEFNECKSDLKFLECAAEGVCALAGKTVYSEAMQRACPIHFSLLPGVRYDSPLSFETSLRYLIQDADRRHEHAETAYAYVRDYRMLSQHFRHRLAWYRNLLGQKSELTRQLLTRAPVLAGDQLVALDP